MELTYCVPLLIPQISMFDFYICLYVFFVNDILMQLYFINHVGLLIV